jgi:hypothetical protein
MTYDQQVNLLTEETRKKIHTAIDKAVDDYSKSVADSIAKSDKINKLCKRPSYIKSDFVWKYYPLVLSGIMVSVCLIAAIAIHLAK